MDRVSKKGFASFFFCCLRKVLGICLLLARFSLIFPSYLVAGKPVFQNTGFEIANSPLKGITADVKTSSG